MKATEDLIKAVLVTVELMGGEISEDAARVFCDDLSEYPEEQVLPALARCRKECRGRLMLVDVVNRLEDGHPGPEEAWALCPKGEDDTIVWTNEIAAAHGVARHLEGDKVAARMAFKEAYTRQLTDARANRVQAKWIVSLGHNKEERTAPLLEAFNKNRLSHDYVKRMLPNIDVKSGQPIAAISVDKLKQLSHDRHETKEAVENGR